MHTSSRSVSPESASVPSVAWSASSQSVSSSHQVPVEVFEGHEAWVFCVSFYPNENKLVSGSRDGILRIWDRNTGVVEVLSGHTRAVWDVDVSLDGRMVVSGSLDHTARIWNGESGEMIRVFEGHDDFVRSVQFSRDSTTVVSGSGDGTVQVWSVETGELVFEPIKCHGYVHCARYSPSGDRIASGGSSVQIWDAKTGAGILTIRNSDVTSLVWTADDTYVIGAGDNYIRFTIWNSHDGEQLRTWKAHLNININSLSLSPTGAHFAVSNWSENIAFIFDSSTGEQVTAFKHGRSSTGVAYSPSGRFIATGCRDMKVYVWEVPAFEDPRAKAQKSPTPSFSWLLDRPAIPQLAGPSRNKRGIDGLQDSQPNRDQHASQPPQRVFSQVRNTFANLFTRRSAGVAPTSPVRETGEPVEVAAGRDRVFWIIILPIVWTPVKKLIYMLFFCRKPEEEDEEVPANTTTNSSQAAAGNAATSDQSERPDTVEGAGSATAGPRSPPTSARNSVIRTQPERTALIGPSGVENCGARPDPAQRPGVIYHQRENIEMIPMPQGPIVPANAPSQHTPSTDPSSPAVVSCKSSPSTAAVMSIPLPVSSHSARPVSAQSPSKNANVTVPIAVTVSLEELAILQELRRRKSTSVLVGTVVEPLSGPQCDHESYAHHVEPSITLAILQNPRVPAHALPQPTPSTDSLLLVVTPCEPSSESSFTAAVTSGPLFVPSDTGDPHSTQPSSQHRELQSGNALSPEELAMIKDLRRRKMLDSIV